MAKEGRYELQVEAPVVAKDIMMAILVSRDTIEISGERSEKSSEKTKEFVCNERSHASFYRKIQVPEDFDPSRVMAKTSNGILVMEMPKKSPLKSRETTKVAIK